MSLALRPYWRYANTLGMGMAAAPDKAPDRGLRFLTPSLNSPQFACLDCVLNWWVFLAPDHVAHGCGSNLITTNRPSALER